MNLIILILVLSYISNLYVYLFDYEPFTRFKSKYLNYKILNCCKCFGFWFSLPIAIYLFPTIFYAITISLIISLVSAIIEKILFTW